MTARTATKPTLAERYVHATVRHVPPSQRDDTARELRASIADMVEARTAAGEAPAAAERAVLTELGDPERLAATYAGRDLVLIGPRLFLHWWRLLKLLVLLVPAIIATIVFIAGVADGNRVGEVIADTLGAAWNVAINVAFWVTVVFAAIERFAPDGVDELDGERWTPDELPEPAEAQGAITLGETAASIGFIALVIAFFPWQEWRPISVGGVDSPLLNPDLWSGWIPYLIAVLVIEIGYELVKYRIGRRTTPLLITHFAINVAFAVPVVWLLLAGEFLHPELAATLQASPATIDTAAAITAATVVVVSLWDLADAAWKTYRT